MILILLALACFAVAILAASNIYRSVSAGPPTTIGTATMNQAGATGVVWNLTFLQISFAGPTVGPNSLVTIWDGPAITGSVLFSQWLTGPTLPGSGVSIGTVQNIQLPCDSSGLPSLQASPGNAMTIVVNGFGANACIINARFSDGIPQR